MPRLGQQPPRAVIVANELDRHGPIEPKVVRAIHNPHTAGANFCIDPVMSEDVADHGGDGDNSKRQIPNSKTDHFGV